MFLSFYRYFLSFCGYFSVLHMVIFPVILCIFSLSSLNYFSILLKVSSYRLWLFLTILFIFLIILSSYGSFSSSYYYLYCHLMYIYYHLMVTLLSSYSFSYHVMDISYQFMDIFSYHRTHISCRLVDIYYHLIVILLIIKWLFFLSYYR